MSEAQTNFQLAQDEENELSEKDKEIQDEGKKFKERHVSAVSTSRTTFWYADGHWGVPRRTHWRHASALSWMLARRSRLSSSGCVSITASC